MWLPEEKTSIGMRESSAKSSLVSPNPPAAFSMLTTVKSMRRLSIKGSSASCKALRPEEPTTSPTKRTFITREPCAVSGKPRPRTGPRLVTRLTTYGSRTPATRILDGPRLPDHGDLDLAGILQLRLDLLGHVAGEPERLVVAQAAGLDDDAQLAAGLDGEGLLDSLETVGDVLELLQPLDVGLQDLAARSRPRGREGVGAVDEHRLERARLVVAMVALHRMDHVTRLAELLQDLSAELQMCPFHLAVDRLAYVVEEAGALGHLDIRAELRRHVGREPGDLLGMLEHVLAVGGAVLQSSQQLDELRVQIRNRELQSGRFSLLADLLPQLRAHLLDDLFNARGVDASVRDEFLQ